MYYKLLLQYTEGNNVGDRWYPAPTAEAFILNLTARVVPFFSLQSSPSVSPIILACAHTLFFWCNLWAVDAKYNHVKHNDVKYNNSFHTQVFVSQR